MFTKCQPLPLVSDGCGWQSGSATSITLQMLALSLALQDTWFWIMDTVSVLLVPRSWILAPGSWLLTPFSLLLSPCSLLLVPCSWPLASVPPPLHVPLGFSPGFWHQFLRNCDHPAVSEGQRVHCTLHCTVHCTLHTAHCTLQCTVEYRTRTEGGVPQG